MESYHAMGKAVEIEISEYWDERAQSYSNGVNGELKDTRHMVWEQILETLAADTLQQARDGGRTLRALDLGCGPGFFSILLAERDCVVDAVDASEGMLAQAQQNADAAGVLERIALHHGDVASLPFPDNSFDLAVSRNVTWLMLDPQAAYAEWLRVLRPGGKMLVFDANWYRYLVDPAVDAARAADQKNNVLDDVDEDSQATTAETKHCEEIARGLPLTQELRPDWDLQALTELGVSAVRADTEIWKHVWTESEQRYYAATPMFLVEVVK